jgi:hypothetical protein
LGAELEQRITLWSRYQRCYLTRRQRHNTPAQEYLGFLGWSRCSRSHERRIILASCGIFRRDAYVSKCIRSGRQVFRYDHRLRMLPNSYMGVQIGRKSCRKPSETVLGMYRWRNRRCAFRPACLCIRLSFHHFFTPGTCTGWYSDRVEP